MNAVDKTTQVISRLGQILVHQLLNLFAEISLILRVSNVQVLDLIDEFLKW